MSAGGGSTAASELLDRLWSTQAAAIDEAAALCAEAIGSGGLVHLFGTGHSRIPVEEMFPRYGSYPGFHPIVELSTTFHTQVVGANGQRQAMFIERVEGLAEVILSNFRLAPPDVMIVFSAGGHGANGIEMAIGARRRGLPVIAVTSLAQSDAVAPTHSIGNAAVRPRRRRHRPVHAGGRRPRRRSTGWTSPVGPGSSIAAVAVVNEIKVQTAAAPRRARRDAAGADERVGRRRRAIGRAVRRRLRASTPAAPPPSSPSVEP